MANQKTGPLRILFCALLLTVSACTSSTQSGVSAVAPESTPETAAQLPNTDAAVYSATSLAGDPEVIDSQPSEPVQSLEAALRLPVPGVADVTKLSYDEVCGLLSPEAVQEAFALKPFKSDSYYQDAEQSNCSLSFADGGLVTWSVEHQVGDVDSELYRRTAKELLVTIGGRAARVLTDAENHEGEVILTPSEGVALRVIGRFGIKESMALGSSGALDPRKLEALGNQLDAAVKLLKLSPAPGNDAPAKTIRDLTPNQVCALNRSFPTSNGDPFYTFETESKNTEWEHSCGDIGTFVLRLSNSTPTIKGEQVQEVLVDGVPALLSPKFFALKLQRNDAWIWLSINEFAPSDSFDPGLILTAELSQRGATKLKEEMSFVLRELAKQGL
jgi:hypothetical protein